MKCLIKVLLMGVPLALSAQNPVIRNQFSADPTARVFNNKVYIYPSHDIMPPAGQRQDWFCMEDYHVFSSENLTDWEDHGMIVTQNKVPWVRPDSYSMWAPDCVYKDGKYYFYFPSAPAAGRGGFAVGVAVADSPTGPFICEPEPIKGISGIDPCVLIDDDGQAYIYWSGGGIRGSKLKSNMKELDGEMTPVQMPQRQGGQQQGGQQAGNRPPMMMAGQNMEGLPEGFKEGPYVFKRNGWYYLTFPWVRSDKEKGGSGTETLAYSMSKNPLGPWEFKGIIMAEHANNCWTNHHSITEYKGQWYLFYHHNDYSPGDDKRRSVCIDKIGFKPDGTIIEVKPTLRGVGIVKATSKIEMDRYSAASADASVDTLDTSNRFQGWCVTLPKKGAWATFNDVDFSDASNAYLTGRIKAEGNTQVFVREKNAKGKVIAKFTLTVVSDGQFRRDQRGQWLTLTAPVEYMPKGITDLCITCEGEGASVDWIQFKNRQTYFTPAAAQPSHPDAEGFIRRWCLLEPIDKPNRSNTVFTDSYLRENFNQQYFANQFTILPKDGDKVKAGKQTLTWHQMESTTFNSKLFRFSEGLQKQVYGVLFWAVTTIDCPEEIKDVRLAVGSNSASMWWLNGEEALLLSGDRRMVKDDCMSPRLTLKKGRNVLRGAIINGPGMSDFCVRFLDEKGQPVKNFTIINNK